MLHVLDAVDLARSRFEERVDRSGDCWIWTGSMRPNGYGRMSIGPRGEAHSYLAHRLAYYYANGAWPKNCVLHSCDNPSCVNPAHLSDGTLAENSRQMYERGRGPDNRGECSGRAKITSQVVADIRRRFEAGETQKSIATDAGLSQSWVSRLVNKRAWRHV